MRIGKTSNRIHFWSSKKFFHIFFRKEAFFICTLFLKKKSYSLGEGLKWQTIYHRFQFCQKILENLDISRGYYGFKKKFCCHAEFKFWKIDQNLHKCKKWSKILQKLKNMIFFVNWRPVSGFQFNVFWNGNFIIIISFKKPYEISGFAHKNPLFLMICWSSPFHDQKIEVLLNKTVVYYKHSLKIWRLFSK